MKRDGRSGAAERVLDVVVEVGLDDPHEALVAGHDLGWQAAFVTLLHQQEVLREEGGLRVPHVHIGLSWKVTFNLFSSQPERATNLIVGGGKAKRLTLVSKEDGASIIGTKKNDLVLLGSDVDDGATGAALSQVIGLDAEHPARAEVAEVQHRGAAAPAHEDHVKHVLAGETEGHRPGEDDAVAVLEGHVVDDDGAGSGVGDVQEDLAVVGVVDHEVLQPRVRAHEVAQVDHSDNLELDKSVSYRYKMWLVFFDKK